MTWKIERYVTDSTATFLLSGRIDSDHLKELKAALRGNRTDTVIDLSEVSLVDDDVIKFLGELELLGVSLVHCPAYIREWINKEQSKGQDVE